MLTQHTLPQTQKNPSSGRITAQIEGEPLFTTDTLNFAYDYYTTDRQLRLTLSAVQMPDNDDEKVIRGIEMVFNATSSTGTLDLKDGKVHATYWKMQAENGETLFQTYDADSGTFTLAFDHQNETYVGHFSFESNGPDSAIARISEGVFTIEGRDNFTL